MFELLAPFMGYIIAFFAAIGALAMAWFSGGQSKKAAMQKEQLQETLSDARDAKTLQDTVRTKPVSTVKRLLLERKTK